MAQRVAVVTGGMGGLGEAICIKLSKMGFTVVTTYSPGNTKAKEWLADMKKQGYEFHAVPADVADFDSCAKAVKQVEAEVGPVDVLVNNAGITRDMTFKKMGKGRLGRGDAHQSRQRVQHDQAGVRRHGRPRLGPHHQRLFGQRPERRVRPDQLLRRQGRHARFHQGAGARSRAKRRDRQHHFARLHRHQDGHGDSRRKCSTPRSSRRFRSAGSASRKKSPGWSPTCARTKRRSSPAPISPSTAASTCNNRRFRHQAGGCIARSICAFACARVKHPRMRRQPAFGAAGFLVNWCILIKCDEI